MRTIDARDLDVPTDELIEYLYVNMRLNVRNQEIILTPTQAENLSYMDNFASLGTDGAFYMGVPVTIKPREQPIQGKPFPEPIATHIPTEERLRGLMIDAVATDESRLLGDRYAEPPRKKKTKKNSPEPRPKRHVPVWED